MNRAGLRNLVRVRLDDLGTTKPKWTDTFINNALDEAVREAAERARLLRDEFADSVCLINVVADTATYQLHAKIFEIDGAYRDDDGRPLTEACEQELYRQEGGQWRSRTGSQPCEFVVQALPNERLQLRLVPIPTEDFPLRLQVYRYPLIAMPDDNAEPEIAFQHHEALVDWAVFRCYSTKDPDLYDPLKAADAETLFTANFGAKISADTRRQRREKRAHVTTARDF